MTRRSCFQTATLSTVAVFRRGAQKPAPANLPAIPVAATTPAEVDIEADPIAAAAHIGNRDTDLFVRLEEMDEHGEYSGATLRILDRGESVALTAGVENILQRDGSRTIHPFGWIGAAELAPIAFIDPANTSKDYGAPFCMGSDQDLSHVWLTFLAGEAPELHLRIMSGHCLGVLRGDLLIRFLACLRGRCAHA